MDVKQRYQKLRREIESLLEAAVDTSKNRDNPYNHTEEALWHKGYNDAYRGVATFLTRVLKEDEEMKNVEERRSNQDVEERSKELGS
jgi:hypothetical protein